MVSIPIEYQYLNAIETSNGKQITYDRLGSFRGADGTLIDGYEIHVQGFLKKKKIATLYLSGYGSENSMFTPKGFRFRRG